MPQMQAKLIDDLLDMNRLLSGNASTRTRRHRRRPPLQTTMQGLQPAADAKGVQLIASVEHDGGQIAADSRRLQQVLWNLVHNAIKFTPKGGRVEIHVAPRRRRAAGSSCRTTARGSAEEFLPHVFERFRQEDSTSTREAIRAGARVVDRQANHRVARRNDRGVERRRRKGLDVCRAGADQCDRFIRGSPGSRRPGSGERSVSA